MAMELPARKDFFSLTERPGWMRLKAFRPIESNQLLKAGNTLTQRTFRKQDNEVIVKMDISQMADGQRNGICHFSSHHSALGVVKEGTQYFIEYRNNGHILKGKRNFYFVCLVQNLLGNGWEITILLQPGRR
mgnify:FL=1